MATLTLEEFLPKARQLNPDYTDDEHIQAYEQRYGRSKPVQTVSAAPLTTYEQFLPKARALNPEYSDEEHYAAWQEKYGARGAREKTPGFGESLVEGAKGGYQSLKASGAGSFERLQDPQSQWHQVGDAAAKAFEEEAAKHAAPHEISQQPWYQRLTNPEYLGKLLGETAVQSAPSLAGAMAGGVVGGIPGAMAGMTAVTYFQQAGSTYREALQRYKQNGLSEEDAHAKAYQDSGIAGLVSGAVNSLAIPASIVAPFAKRISNLFLQYSLNVGVDTADQITQNAVAKNTFAPERELSAGVPEAVVGSALMSAPETMGGVKAVISGPAKAGATEFPEVTERTPDEMGIKQPDVLTAPRQIEGPIQPGEVRGGKIYAPGEVLDVAPLPDVSPVLNAGSLDDAIANAVGVVRGATETGKARAAEFARMTAKSKNETDALLANAPEKRPAFEVPTLPGPEAQPETLLNQPSPIVPGQAFTPRSEPVDDPRARLAEERARLVEQREQQRLTQPVNPVSEPVEPAQAVAQSDTPLPTQIDLAYPSSKQVRDLIHEKGLHLDTPVFREILKQTVQKEKFTDLTPQELQTLSEAVQKIKAPQSPTQSQEVPPQVPLTPAAEKPYAPVTTIPEAQVPRSELTPEKNAEILLRAEKAKADLEIAGQETGRRKVFTDNQNAAGQTVTGLASAAPDWYTELQSGPGKVSADYKTVGGKRVQTKSAREKIEEAIQKIIKDQGADRGKAVEQVKAALLQDTEFHQTEWGRDLSSILQGQWPSYMDKPEGVTQATENSEQFQNVPRGTPQGTVEEPKKVPISRKERLAQQKQKMDKQAEPLPSEAPGMEPQPATASPEREPAPSTLEAAPKPEEPFSLSSPEVSKPKAKEQGLEQLSIDVPPPTSGERPIIGREATLDEAPLFSKNAQTPDAEQTSLSEPIEKTDEAPIIPKQDSGSSAQSIAPEITPAQSETAQSAESAQSPTEIIADALRTAADKIEGRSIQDVGEKVGGARKDLVGKSEPKTAKPKPEGPAWERRYQVSQIVGSWKPSENGKWSIHDTKDKDFAGRPQQIGELFDSEEEAKRMIPVVVVAKTHRVYQGRDGKWEIFKRSGDRKLIHVVNQKFDTEEEAKRYLAKNAAEILEAKTFFGEEILPRPEKVDRLGTDRRDGRNVDANDFKDTFGFRAVEFGNWQNQDDRQELMNYAYDGLHDLAETIKIPPRAIGLNGDLALAFGSRGHGLSWAAAHYERNYGVINLTKMQGAGHLAHEWFHAADHYFGRQDTKASSEKEKNERGDLVYKAKTPSSDYASHGFRVTGSNVRPEVREAYKSLIRTMIMKGEQFVEDAQRADKFVAQARGRVSEQLESIRNSRHGGLSVKVDYGKRNTAPASAEQLAEFDAIAQRILEGETFEQRFVSSDMAKKSRRYIMAGRWSNDALEKISAIYKAVRGRSGFGSGDQKGVLDDLRHSMNFYKERLKMLADAQAGTEKIKQVPTSYAMEAKSMDQGRKDAYWATEHEMAARAFAAYVEDKLKADGKKSDFITYKTFGAVPTIWGWKKPYPEGEERKSINEAFDKFIGSLQTKETDRGIALYDLQSKYGLTDHGGPGDNQPYVLREGESRERNSKLASKAINELNEDSAVYDTTGRISRDRPPARTIALSISPQFVEQGSIDLSGQVVSSPEDLAKLAQVYRNPLFETLRIFYVKGGKIVGHEGITSRLPGLVKFGVTVDEVMQRVGDWDARKQALGATSYYLLHNHPSGNSLPSRADFSLTEKIASLLPGFKGHVVIDSNEFTTIASDGKGNLSPATKKVDFGKDRLLTPSIPHPLLNATVFNSTDMAKVGKSIQAPRGFATVLYRSGGLGGKTRAIQEVSAEFLANPDQAKTYIQQQADAFGAVDALIHYSVQHNDGLATELARSMDSLIEDGVVLDYVTSGDAGRPMSRRDLGVDPKSKSASMGRTIEDISTETTEEERAPYETGTIDPTDARDRLAAVKSSARPYLLGALGLEQLSQVYGNDHAEVRQYNKATQAMEADFTEMSRDSDKVARAWTDLNIPVADKMAQVMEDARFLNFDPDPKKSQEIDSEKKQKLRDRFEQLPEYAKSVYRMARDFYTNMAEQRFQALKERIERAGGTPENTRKLVDRLQVAYEQVRSKVYFPFSRFGEHIVVAKQMKDGKEVDREVHAFESSLEAQKFATMMKLKGWQVKQTVAREYSVDKEGPASKIVREMHDIIKKMGEGQQSLPDIGVLNLEKQLLDSLNQSFLQALPDMSYAKHFIHAKDVKGASKDALRAFAHSALHGAHHISRIRHADKVTKALMDLDENITKANEGDMEEARQVYNELVRRHNDIMNPNTHPFSAWLGQLGFTMSLGGVVATGITNATQVPLVTYPWLGARYGFGKASAALARAYKDFLDPRTLNKDSLFDATKGKLISESERKMLLELAKRGHIDLTQTMDLAGLSSRDNLSRKARTLGTVGEKVTRMLGFTFHVPEVMNRQVTALATFRLERAKEGSTYEGALEKAQQAVQDTHFIYQSWNRPRYMQGNFLRVLTMFKQYSQWIAFTYGKAAHIWLGKNNLDADERKIAKRQLASMLVLQFGAAGALGMPFFGTPISLVMAALNAIGDDDEEQDWEVALRKWLDGTATSLAEAFMDDKEQAGKVGREIGAVASHGLSRFSPFDMANRLGQNDLFYREPQLEREGKLKHYEQIASLGGPVPGYLMNMFMGWDDINKGRKELNAGFFMRGVEELTPAVLRHGLRSLRYTLEGVRTRDEYKQLDLTTSEKLGQAFGFTPSRVAEMYESTTAVKNKEHRILNEQKSLKNRFARAVDDQDDNAKQRILEDIRGFNERNPIFAITSNTLNRSLKARRQHEAGMERGMYLPPRRRALLDEGDWADF